MQLNSISWRLWFADREPAALCNTSDATYTARVHGEHSNVHARVRAQQETGPREDGHDCRSLFRPIVVGRDDLRAVAGEFMIGGAGGEKALWDTHATKVSCGADWP